MVRAKGSEVELPKPGTYSAVCNRVVDVGTQRSEYGGKVNFQRKVIIGWELSAKKRDGNPFSVSRWFTVSIGEKSNLGPLLESWRGEKFTDQERRDGVDLKALIGKSCLISLILEGENKIKVSAVMPMPEGMPVYSSSSHPVYFDLDDFNAATFDLFSDKLKEIIKKSPEYQVATGNQVAAVDVETDQEVPF